MALNMLLHGALQMSMETPGKSIVWNFKLVGDSVACLLITHFRFLKQIQHYA